MKTQHWAVDVSRKVMQPQRLGVARCKLLVSPLRLLTLLHCKKNQFCLFCIVTYSPFSACLLMPWPYNAQRMVGKKTI